MARCWSCGAGITGGLHPRYWFTCPNCAQVEELESLRREASNNLTELGRIQEHGFETLSDRLSEVANVIEWGFEEIKWQLEQQTNILRSIDHTLKTPSETRANEWRSMAEELRRRGDLPKALELFLKAGEANPLDYRIYIGLAYTYLEMNQFGEARETLEKSILHVPRAQLPNYEEVEMGGEYYLVYPGLKDGGPFWIDENESIAKRLPHTLSEIPEWRKAQEKQEDYYRSYSKRLIGHIHACEENYDQAARILQSALELSPNYEDAHYDYAQYCALVGKKEDCLASLRKAILAKPLYFHLAQKERNFAPIRGEVDNLLWKHKAEILYEAEEAISLAEEELGNVGKAIPMIEETLLRSLGWSENDTKQKKVSGQAKSRLDELETKKIYSKARSDIQAAKEGASSGDYIELVSAKDIALESKALAVKAKEKAHEERKAWETERRRKLEEEAKERKGISAWVFAFLGVVLGFPASAIGVITQNWWVLIIGVTLLIGAAIVAILTWLRTK